MYKIPEIICILLPIAFCSIVVYNCIVRLRKGKQLACEKQFQKNLKKVLTNLNEYVIINVQRKRKRDNEYENVFVRNVNNVFMYYNNNNYCKYLD